MKAVFKNYWFFLLLLFISNSLLAQDSFDLLKKELDQTLADEPLYLNKKNSAINQLKSRLRTASSNEIRYSLNEKLYDEYKSYQSDSALVYAKRSLQIANTTGNNNQIGKAQLNLASILGTLGMYNQALEILDPMESTVVSALKGEFYWTKRIIYGGLSSYANDIAEKNKYNRLGDHYRDKAILHLPKNSIGFVLAFVAGFQTSHRD